MASEPCVAFALPAIVNLPISGYGEFEVGLAPTVDLDMVTDKSTGPKNVYVVEFSALFEVFVDRTSHLCRAELVRGIGGGGEKLAVGPDEELQISTAADVDLDNVAGPAFQVDAFDIVEFSVSEFGLDCFPHPGRAVLERDVLRMGDAGGEQGARDGDQVFHRVPCWDLAKH